MNRSHRPAVTRWFPIALIAATGLLLWPAVGPHGPEGCLSAEARAADAAEEGALQDAPGEVALILKVRLTPSEATDADPAASRDWQRDPVAAKRPADRASSPVEKLVAVVRILVRVADCLLRYCLGSLTSMAAFI